MALDNQKLEYVIEFLTKGDTEQAINQLRKLQDQGDKTSKGFETLKLSAEKFLALFGGEIVLTEALNKFLDTERASAKLEAALRSAGDGGKEMRGEGILLINEIKELTTYSGEAINNVVA